MGKRNLSSMSKKELYDLASSSRIAIKHGLKDSTLKNMTKDQLIKVIQNYE